MNGGGRARAGEGKGTPFLLRTGTMAAHTPGLESPGSPWVTWNYPLEKLKHTLRGPTNQPRCVNYQRRQYSMVNIQEILLQGIVKFKSK